MSAEVTDANPVGAEAATRATVFDCGITASSVAGIPKGELVARYVDHRDDLAGVELTEGDDRAAETIGPEFAVHLDQGTEGDRGAEPVDGDRPGEAVVAGEAEEVAAEQAVVAPPDTEPGEVLGEGEPVSVEVDTFAAEQRGRQAGQDLETCAAQYAGRVRQERSRVGERELHLAVGLLVTEVEGSGDIRTRADAVGVAGGESAVATDAP